MTRNREKQYALMYASRLIYKDNDFERSQYRSLAFTVQVKSLDNARSVKKAIFEKIHRSLFGKVSSATDSNISVFVASDVEASRGEFVPENTLLRPIIPHFHGIIVFSDEAWADISEDIPGAINRIKRSIAEIVEVKPDELDSDGTIKSESVWMEPFDCSKQNHAKDHFPLGRYVQYSMKAHLQACARGVDAHEPSVFPFDAYATEVDITAANRLFLTLWEQQQSQNTACK